MRQIQGFDYLQQKPLALSRPEWRAKLQAAIDAGGRRRAEAGETFIIHPGRATPAYEVYAIIQEGRDGSVPQGA